MNLTEKLAQKLQNLLSKKQIVDYVLYNDEYYKVRFDNKIDKNHHLNNPIEIEENSRGLYTIVWNEHEYSEGEVDHTYLNKIDEWIETAYENRLTLENNEKIFIPSKNLYPLVICNDRQLSNSIYEPEYLFKIIKLIEETAKILNIRIDYNLEVVDGTRYLYSSRGITEEFIYTKFDLKIVIPQIINWSYTISYQPSLKEISELLSFIGNYYDLYKKSKEVKTLNLQDRYVVFGPQATEEILTTFFLSNFSSERIVLDKSIYKVQDFLEKKKLFGRASIAYDPQLKQQPGSYRFTSYGTVAEKQYIIKFGKLNVPFGDNKNYLKYGLNTPTVEFIHFNNLTFEGIKNQSIINFSNPNFVYCFCLSGMKNKNGRIFRLIINNALYTNSRNTNKIQILDLEIDLAKKFENSEIEFYTTHTKQRGMIIKV